MQIQHKNNRSKQSILRTGAGSEFDTETLRPDKQYIVQEVRELTETTYVIRFNKNDMDFRAGQHITLGLPGDNQMREYSVYSPSDSPYLEVLIREVEEGTVSRKLHRVQVGDSLKVEGPFGFFTLDEQEIKEKKFLFIASGTGIAPFHSMAGSHPGLDYRIIHGVRHAREAYERDHYPETRYTACVSRDDIADFHGRVTDYLRMNRPDSETLVYLCGNVNMIYEAYDLLTSGGLDANQIRTEVYF